MTQRAPFLFAGVALLFIVTGFWLCWNVSLNILNIGILSAIMALGGEHAMGLCRAVFDRHRGLGRAWAVWPW